MMENVAIVGSSGYIAGFLIKKFEQEHYTVLKIDRTESADKYLDLQRPNEFDYELLNDIDYIVFTAAISSPDKCAEEFNQCWDINVKGTKHFISEAISRNCKVLFFSSDAVFGDIPGAIYDEESVTDAKTPYGIMKKTVEDSFMGCPNFKAIRLSYVVSKADKFVTYCLSCVKSGETADIFHPFYRNVIVVSDVVNVVLWFFKHWMEYTPPVLNVSGKELVSRIRIADEINRILGNQLNYKIIKPNGGFYKNRPEITQMRSLYIKTYKILEDNTFTEKIKHEFLEITV